MASDGRFPQATELIYVPAPSWTPALTAVGVALVATGFFTGLFWIIAGAVLVIASLFIWLRDAGDEVARMPVEQRPLTAVLPPETD